MSQRLILPLNDLRVTAAYKTPEYRQYWGWDHYGYDCTSPVKRVLACGSGEVVACGQDGAAQTGPASRLGNVIVIVYRDVLCNDGKVRDLACRMYHLERIDVAVGDRVTRGQQIGVYGNTGANTTGAHLHIEFDSDIGFPTLAYGVTVGGRVINTAAEYQRAGGLADSTIDPDAVWFVGDGQSIKAASATWSDADDCEAPLLPQDKPSERPQDETITIPRKDWNTLCAALQAAVDALRKAGEGDG